MGRAIVRDPKAFLMDEPLSNLDAKLRVQMRTQVARIQHQLGTTMLYVTHDQTEAMTLGDRVAVMRAGIIQQVDTPKVLYEDPANLFVAGFIGSPAMNFVPGPAGGRRRSSCRSATRRCHRRSARSCRRCGGGGGARDVIAGVRPEHFEDARLDESAGGHRLKFTAKVDVVESMGSELYAYFEIEGAEEIHSDQLDELAADAGLEDLPSSGAQIVARLDAACRRAPTRRSSCRSTARRSSCSTPRAASRC